MQIRIVAVGKIKEKFLQEGIAEYEKRLRPYAKVQIVEVPEEKRPVSASASVERAAMEKEGERILAAIPDGSFVIALDIQGTGLVERGAVRHRSGNGNWPVRTSCHSLLEVISDYHLPSLPGVLSGSPSPA